MKNFMSRRPAKRELGKKLIIIPILSLAILLSGCINDKPVFSDSEPPASPVNKSSSSQTPQTGFSPITDSQDGVDVTVEDVKKESGKTIIDLALNNHRYDLSAMDVQGRSNFSGINPTDYIVKSTAMGGHHVEAEMIFDEELSGPLTIGLDDSLVFNFNIQ